MNVNFTPGSAAINVLDNDSARIRRPVTRDYVRYAKLMTGMTHIASQATALHGALCAPPGAEPRPGFLASARKLQLHAARLDERTGPLGLQATRVAGDDAQALYDFTLCDADGALLAEGRLTVVHGRTLVATGA
jgi:predicted hotdog family 3-hydroxylacyl-ACP dehydratase